jgi:hypothetical protein
MPQTRNWSAWRDDEQPNGTSKIHVHGECVFPTAGYGAELQLHEPRGNDAQELILDLIVRPPADEPAPAETVAPADYVMEERDATYHTVSVLQPDGARVTLSIQAEPPATAGIAGAAAQQTVRTGR